MRQLVFLSLSVIICISLACSRKNNGVRSDEAITQNIEKRVSAEPQTQQPKLKVDAHNGVVVLYGDANSEAARHLIETIAWEEPGVKSVDNRMTVEGEEAAAPNYAPGDPPPRGRVHFCPSPPPPRRVCRFFRNSADHMDGPGFGIEDQSGGTILSFRCFQPFTWKAALASRVVFC